MYGYQLLLMSPNGSSQTVLRVVSAKRYLSVVSFLKGEDLWDRYHGWTLLRFETAFSCSTQSQPVLVDQQTAPPGTLLNIAA